jgi:hypothetical protein
VKLTICHGKTKRDIKGPFNICASRDDLTTIRDCIDEWLRHHGSYGWVEVADKQSEILNTSPLPWDEEK